MANIGLRERGFRGAMVLVFFLGSVVFSLSPPAAGVDPCDNKDQIFWQDRVSGDWRRHARGTSDVIRFHVRDFNETCHPVTVAWSTAHITLGGTWGHWAEVGWRMRCCVPVNEPYFQWFSEWRTTGNVEGGAIGGYPCPQVEGQGHKWRVTKILGTTKWNLRVGCDPNSGGTTLLDTTGPTS